MSGVASPACSDRWIWAPSRRIPAYRGKVRLEPVLELLLETQPAIPDSGRCRVGDAKDRNDVGGHRAESVMVRVWRSGPLSSVSSGFGVGCDQDFAGDRHRWRRDGGPAVRGDRDHEFLGTSANAFGEVPERTRHRRPGGGIHGTARRPHDGGAGLLGIWLGDELGMYRQMCDGHPLPQAGACADRLPTATCGRLAAGRTGHRRVRRRRGHVPIAG